MENADHTHHKKKLVKICAFLDALINKFDKIYAADGVKCAFDNVFRKDVPDDGRVALVELAEGF